VLTFRALAATLVTLQIGFWVVSIGLRVLVHFTGFEVLATGDFRIYVVACAVMLPAAFLAGWAAVRAAYEATSRLVGLCAIASGATVLLWSYAEPWLGREPAWFRVALPLAVAGLAGWSGRTALRRREEEAGRDAV